MNNELIILEMSATISADAVADMARAEQYRAVLQAEVAASDYDWSGFSL